MVNKGNHPQMAELFRLVKYDHLPTVMALETCYKSVKESMKMEG